MAEVNQKLHGELLKVIETGCVDELKEKLQTSPTSDVIQAVQHRSGTKGETILHYLASGVSITDCIPKMQTILSFLKQHEHHRGDYLSILLIGNDFKVGWDQWGGDTALHYAARRNEPQLVKSIIYSLSFDQERLELITQHNVVRTLDECPPSSEGYETALHLAGEEIIKICLESVVSEKMRVRMLLEVAESGDAVIHHCYSSASILNEAITKHKHKLRLLLARNERSRNCLLQASIFESNYSAIDTMLASLENSPNSDIYTSQLILDREPHYNHTAAFLVVHESGIPSLQRIMNKLSNKDKMKFVSNGGRRKDKTIFHHYAKRLDTSTLPLLMFFLECFSYNQLINLMTRKTTKGFTVLHLAALNNNMDVIKAIHDKIKPSDWKSLLSITVLDNEAGGLEARNELIRLLSGNKMNHRYYNNEGEIKRRARAAADGKLEPVTDIRRGDTALTYCIIHDHSELFSYLATSVDENDALQLLELDDVFGLKISAEDYIEETSRVVWEVRYDTDYFQ